MKSSVLHLGLAVTMAMSCPLFAQAAGSASDGDKAFTGKVSQGGMYEVEASKVAAQKAAAQDVRDLAITEVHDHSLVNSELKKIATSDGVEVAPHLNATFQQRLDKLKSVSGTEFDLAYASDMAQIHDMDEKLFAQEAIDGSGQFKAFAAKTDLIVKRHIGAIHGADPQ
jgi:putative membrane protein